MTDINAPQGVVLAAVEATSHEVETTQFVGMAVYNIPSESIASTQGDVYVTIRQLSPVSATFGAVLAVVKGRVYDPMLKAWTFTLDGHPCYVLRLADDKTLIYDTITEQWSWWSSGDNYRWRAAIGMNWKTPGPIANNYGSNVVVGDDTLGILWVLNPMQGYDDDAVNTEVQNTFPRVATGQMIARGRNFIPVYEVYLTASLGDPALSNSTVTLSYSDTQGDTFVSAGTIEVEEGNYFQEFAWRSLGRIQAPGRLFQIADDGAFARIDGLDVKDG